MLAATGPWKERLSNAFHDIESLKGVLDLAASSARLRAQLAMFVWFVLFPVPCLFFLHPASTRLYQDLTNLRQ